MSAENVELARRIYSVWERGDYSDASWAAEDIEYESRFVPQARVHGVEEMGRAWGEVLREWRDFHTRAEEFRDVADRIIVITSFGGEGKQSGVSLGEWRGYADFTFSDGKVTRLSVGPGEPED